MAEVVRGSTDRTTALVLLPSGHVEEDLPALLRPGAGPERLLAAFLHEATHYWCFNSPVGAALALLQMRIHRQALRYSDTHESHLVHDIAECLNRYETALAFLHPIDEGMALFAEFDLKTRQESKVWSEPFELAALFFAEPKLLNVENDEKAAMTITAWAQGVVQRLRMRQELIDRKVGILGMPLTCSGDAYLPGYLLVRQLWIRALRREWRLANETDLFLTYLRAFIYEDTGLVDILLDPSLDEIRGASAVANRIVQRMGAFTQLDAAKLAAFEEAIANREKDQEPLDLSETLDIDDAEDKRGRSRLEQAISEFDDTSDSGDQALQLRQWQLLLRRQFLYVGSWPVDVEVAGTRVVVRSGGVVVQEATARPGVTDGQSGGYIDILQWVPRRQRVCAVVRDGEVVSTQSLWGTSMENDKELIALLGQRDEAGALLASLDKVVNVAVSSSWAEVAVTHVRTETARSLDQTYLGLALLDVPDDKLDTIIDLMRDDGVYPLLNYDRQLIEGLAALSICCSAITPQESAAAAFLEHRGLSLNRTLEAAESLYEAYGFGRVWREKGYILPSV